MPGIDDSGFTGSMQQDQAAARSSDQVARNDQERGAFTASVVQSVKGLSWLTMGMTVQLEPNLAAFMADLASVENCTVDVCMTGANIQRWGEHNDIYL